MPWWTWLFVAVACLSLGLFVTISLYAIYRLVSERREDRDFFN